MFCSNCGGIIEEGSKFCAKCGTAVNTATVPSTPPPAGAFGGVTPEQMKGNTMAGQTTQPYAAMQANSQNQSQYTEPPVIKGKSKLLPIACIIPSAICLLWLVIGLVARYRSKTMPDVNWVVTIISFVILTTIPTLLTVFGGRKNNKIMILIAGIIYIFSIWGIPSAIMCFIAFAKMKSETK
jgi:hypothetical protein